MAPDTSLESIEREAYISQHADGLLDILLGAGLLVIGIAWLTDHAWAGAIVPPLLVPLWKPLRVQIFEPRAGRVEFRDDRRRLERRKLMLLFALGVVVLIAGVALFVVMRERALDWSAYVAAVPGLLLACGSAIVAGLFGLRRFFLYAFLLMIVGRTAVSGNVEPGLYMAEIGAFVTVVGCVLLTRFIRTNPIPDIGDHA